MKKNGYITYGILILFHLVIFIMSFYVDYLTKKQDLGSLFTISKYAFLFKYLTFIGLALIVYNYILSAKSIKDYKSDNETLTKEMTTLKAKLFDLQEAAKK
ncbi:MAG TPA: hypothetical protein VL443_01840 [Cyclobacteriaceae bacterium]|nr:hypothetical protein [Cyclobacteriaceae bacterium]